MDWKNLNADVNKILNTHYTSGRSGRKINKIIIHYNAGDLTVEGCYSVWQNRPASAHYQVESSGRIGQLVWDSDTAWHASNWDANCSSIGIEHANKEGGYISEACLDAGAHLVAALCKYYGLGRPQWKVNVFPHNHFAATSCPGRLQDEQRDAYMQKAQQWYDQMMNGTESPSTPSTGNKKSSEEVAREVVAGKWGNGADRKNRLTSAGYDYNAIQSLVNQMVGNSSPAPKPTKTIDQLADEVIAGKWGNGADRKNRLTSAGYNYDVVQAKVDEKLYGSKPGKSNEAIAKEVIAGNWGNGADRKARLTAAGYNYDAIQSIVNSLCK
ncbi:N-acetylmuramoyl-L-alanine amidase [uncultured Holdemanella sp.]|uniref:N-acetylmuramoyl-L-alanine amidase n=1 Tax=uncultured Holdemanella sp. TaxID=1763549 RepID=UPI0025DFD668|nr:N-acetylmuramoyl-L-alanine amidase [uncultured Holdemanella sp.]